MRKAGWIVIAGATFAVVVAAAVGAIVWSTIPQGPPSVTDFPPWYAAENADGDPAFADFEAHVPCSIDPAPDPGCQRVKFGLVLYRDDETHEPTSYVMSIIRVGVSDEREVHEGALRIERGTALHPEDPVYRLDGVSDHLRDFWAVGDDLLLLLDAERMPRVGDAGYSFTLNRTPLRTAG